MELYLAPLEGITTYTYRNTHSEMFGGCDKYFAPFITPTENEKVGIRVIRDIVPDKNLEIDLVPQVLSNKAEAFLGFLPKIKELGYTSVNLNFGCPSGTVVKKGRGAGFLKDVEGIDEFLCRIFEKADIEISVKTRIGFWQAEEMEHLTEVYNKYPISLLIIHPRTRENYYNGVPDMAAFKKAYDASKIPVCYNGNVFSMADFEKIKNDFPGLHSVMLGRGAVANPAIFREIGGGERLKTAELAVFTAKLQQRYMSVLGSEVYTLHKLKEIWMYMMWNFPDEKKLFKAIKKSSTLADLNAAISQLPELE